MDKKLIDPLEIESDFPIITLVSHNNQIISWLIRVFSKGSYNHVCWLYKPRIVASQDASYKIRPLFDYMRVGYKLKFYKLINITCVQRILLLAMIQEKLKKGVVKSRYDFLGIIGQATGLRFINNPWTNYCSESVGDDIRKIFGDIRRYPTPEDIDNYCGDHPNFEYLGHWIGS